MTNHKLFFILPLILCFFTLPTLAHYEDLQCNHDNEEHSPQLLDVDEELIETDGRTLASAPNIRIYPYYDLLTGGSKSFRSYIKYDLIPPVLDYFEKALRVRYPLKTALKVSSKTREICEYRTPRILQTTGVAADHFMIFSVGASSGKYVASSRYCFISSGVKRPIISRVQFTTSGLKLPKGDVLLHESNTYVLMHELMHSFGFTSGLFPFFVDERGNRRQGHIRKVSLHGKTRTILDIPSLTNKLRHHFGCSSLPGAYLENDGDAEMTAGSHFERKLFLMDFMTSGVLAGRRVSEFSLAVLEGSGWYQPDYDYAEPYHYGAGQGCGFINNKCGSRAEFEEFCVGSQRGCFIGGRGGGKCKKDKNADGCKYHFPSDLFDCENADAKGYTRLSSVQAYGRGAGSKCFEGTLSTKRNDKTEPFCLKYDCSGSGSNTELSIKVGTHKIRCEREGPVSVQGYHGTIQCPDPLHFCRTAGKEFCPRNCMGRGSCVNNKCRCRSGYTGIDCALRK